MNGARRLHQLYKNAVLLSLIRQVTVAPATPARRTLFNAVAEASLKEAQRTLMLLGITSDHHAQRRLIVDAMDYCFSGSSDLVTKPDGQRMLDGLFSTYFAPPDSRVLNRQLASLYQDKPLMIQACIAFIVIFLGFLNDPRYYVRGISVAGIEAELSLPKAALQRGLIVPVERMRPGGEYDGRSADRFDGWLAGSVPRGCSTGWSSWLCRGASRVAAGVGRQAPRRDHRGRVSGRLRRFSGGFLEHRGPHQPKAHLPGVHVCRRCVPRSVCDLRP
jgi:hypothetical protein